MAPLACAPLPQACISSRKAPEDPQHPCHSFQASLHRTFGKHCQSTGSSGSDPSFRRAFFCTVSGAARSPLGMVSRRQGHLVDSHLGHLCGCGFKPLPLALWRSPHGMGPHCLLCFPHPHFFRDQPDVGDAPMKAWANIASVIKRKGSPS